MRISTTRCGTHSTPAVRPPSCASGANLEYAQVRYLLQYTVSDSQVSCCQAFSRTSPCLGLPGALNDIEAWTLDGMLAYWQTQSMDTSHLSMPPVPLYSLPALSTFPHPPFSPVSLLSSTTLVLQYVRGLNIKRAPPARDVTVAVASFVLLETDISRTQTTSTTSHESSSDAYAGRVGCGSETRRRCCQRHWSSRTRPRAFGGARSCRENSSVPHIHLPPPRLILKRTS